MSAGRVKAGQVFVEIGADPRAFFAALNRINRQIGAVGRSVASAGAKLGAIGAGVAAPFAAAAVAGSRFEDTLLAVRASTGATATQLEAVKAAAMATSAELGVGPTQATQGFLELLKAGMSLEDVLGGAGQTALQFAKVGQMDVAAAAVVMADAMKVFGVSSEVAANTLSAAADASSTSVEEMTMAFSQSSAVAALANQSMGDLSAALAILANNGVKGSDAGTSVKTMLMRLMAPADDAVGALNQIGLSVQSFRGADGQIKPMVEIIRTLNGAMAGMDQAARDDIFRRIFGQDAIRAAAILTSTGTEGFDAMRQAMGKALPVGEKFGAMASGLSGAMANIRAALERAAIAVSDAIGPALMGIAGPIADVIGGFAKFVAANQELVATIAKVAVGAIAVGGVLVGLGGTLTFLSAAIAPVLASIGAIGTVIGVVMSPVGLLVAGLAALAVAGPKVAASMGGMFAGVGGAVQSVAESIGSGFNAAVSNGMTVLGDLSNTATVTFDGIYAAIAEGDLAGAMDVLWAGLYAGWLRGVEAIMGAVDPWVSAFQNVFTILGAEIYKVWDSMWTSVGGVMNMAGAYLMGAMDNIINPLLAAWDTLEAGIRKSWNRVQSLFRKGFNLKAENEKVDSEMAARRRQRELDRPGVEGRTDKASKENAQAERDLRDRQKAIDDNTQATIDQRNAENQRRADERRADTQAAEGALAGMSRGKREASARGQQFSELLKQIKAASTQSALDDAMGEANALIENGRVTAAQASALESAMLAAQDKIAAAEKAAGATGGSSPSQQIAAGAGAAGAAAATSAAEVAGTFSSVNLGGMGFGSSLGERQLRALETIASNTANLEPAAVGE